jgi:hypothetical protein
MVFGGTIKPVAGQSPSGLDPKVVISRYEELGDGKAPEGLQGL